MHVGLAALQPFGQQKSRSRGLGGLKALPLERNSDARTYAGSSRTPIIIVSYNGPQIYRPAIGENNPIAEQRALEEPTMWWFVALPFLLGLSVLDIIAKSTGGPATPPLPPAPSIIEDVTFFPKCLGQCSS